MNTLMRRRRRGQANRLVFGVVLIVVGGLLLAGRLGLDVPDDIWRYWPFLLIALGATRLLLPNEDDGRRGGYWLLVVGFVGWISQWRLFGLDWGSSWPIFVIAAGLLILLEGGRGRLARGEPAPPRSGEGENHAT